MSNPQSYLHQLILSNHLRESVIREAIKALRLPKGSRGLDAGCGSGQQAVLLAEEVGHSGHVTGLDITPEFIQYSEKIAEEKGMSTRVSFREGNINNLPFDNNSFDWVWSIDCAGYAPGNPLHIVKKLCRVVKPGGILALIAWSSQMLLPGYPELEAKLNATSSGISPFRKSQKPEMHFFRMMRWFQKAGLSEIQARTFAGSAFAPLSDELREALLSLIDMRWPNVQSELSADDWDEFQRLTESDSPYLILNTPDYYAFFTYSQFQGTITK